MGELVYVCSPLRGDIDKNVAFVHDVCSRLLVNGYYPVCSHGLAFKAVGLVSEEEALTYSKRLIDMCDILLVAVPSIATVGMKVEIDYAVSVGKRIVYGLYALPRKVENEEPATEVNYVYNKGLL